MRRLIAGRRENRSFALGTLLGLDELDVYLIALYLDRSSAYRFALTCWRAYRTVLPYLRALARQPPTFADIIRHFNALECPSRMTLLCNLSATSSGTPPQITRRVCSLQRVAQGFAVTILDEVHDGTWLSATIKYHRADPANPCSLALVDTVFTQPGARASTHVYLDPMTYRALMSHRIGACCDEPGFADRKAFEQVRGHFAPTHGAYPGWLHKLFDHNSLSGVPHRIFPTPSPVSTDALRTYQHTAVRFGVSLAWLLNRELVAIPAPRDQTEVTALRGIACAEALTRDVIAMWNVGRHYRSRQTLALAQLTQV